MIPKSIALASVFWILPLQHVTAETWQIEGSAEGVEDRISSVIEKAAPGDTLLIGPGLYYENLDLPAGDWTLLASPGADGEVILDGRTEGAIISGVGAERIYSMVLPYSRVSESGSMKTKLFMRVAAST